MRDIIVVLFDGFETLDVFGPVEVLGRMTDAFSPVFCSLQGGVITSSQSVPVMTESLAVQTGQYILFIPGGAGVREMIQDKAGITAMKALAMNAEFILTVCTGSILLARTGILEMRRATTNKRLFAWTSQFPGVTWIQKARWVKDGKIYTSSGVSAGIDMALGFVSDLFGSERAEQVSREIEYEWNRDPDRDPFSDWYATPQQIGKG